MKREKSSKSSKIRNLFLNETSALKECMHSNILRLIDFSEHAIAKRSDSKTMEVAYIALEYVPNGEIFDLISESGRFSEPVARFYFKQLIDAMEAINQKGYCHRDIKPENILLDENFCLKLVTSIKLTHMIYVIHILCF